MIENIAAYLDQVVSQGVLSLSPPGWGGALLVGLLHTITIVSGAYIIAVVLGILGATGKIYGGPLIRDWLSVYTTLVRAVPELVLILILFYAVPKIINDLLVASGLARIGFSPTVVGMLVLGVVIGAYMTEIFRGAIIAVSRGQTEAALAFGMSTYHRAVRITLPQMLANALPGMANLWLSATKDTALLAVIGFNELTLVTKQAAGSTRAFFTFFIASGCLYLLVSVLSTQLFAWAERRARRGAPEIRRGKV